MVLQRNTQAMIKGMSEKHHSNYNTDHYYVHYLVKVTEAKAY